MDVGTGESQQMLTANSTCSSIHKLKLDVYYLAGRSSLLIRPDSFRSSNLIITYSNVLLERGSEEQFN